MSAADLLNLGWTWDGVLLEQIQPENLKEFEAWLAQPKGCCAPDGDGHLWILRRFWQHEETGRLVAVRYDVDLSRTHTEITLAQYYAAQPKGNVDVKTT